MKFLIEKNKEPIIKNSLQFFNFFKWDCLWAYHPCVLKHKRKYYMIYTGKSLKLGIAHNIGIAVSSDLEKWRKLPSPILELGARGDWDNDFVAHAYVFKEDSKFYMLYDGSRKGKWLEEIGLAESEDLLHWEKSSHNPIFRVGSQLWEKNHVSRCCVYKDKNIYYLFYAGNDGRRERIGLAKGISLTSLKRFTKEPILTVGEKGQWDEESISDPRVIKYKNKYIMFYTGIDFKGIERIGLAFSKDLLVWEKYNNNPVLDVSLNSWDSISVARADIKLFDDQLYIFYSGKRRYTYSVGVAKLFFQ